MGLGSGVACYHDMLPHSDLWGLGEKNIQTKQLQEYCFDLIQLKKENKRMLYIHKPLTKTVYTLLVARIEQLLIYLSYLTNVVVS